MLPNLKEIIGKHWDILNINPDYRETFETPPIIAFQINTSLKQIIGTNIIRNRKYLKPANFSSKRKCSLVTVRKTMCCKQVNTTRTFTSNQTNEIFNSYHKLNCKSKYVIYLLECSICKIQFVGKSETPFHIRLNTTGKTSKTQVQYQPANFSTHPTMISIRTKVSQ